MNSSHQLSKGSDAIIQSTHLDTNYCGGTLIIFLTPIQLRCRRQLVCRQYDVNSQNCFTTVDFALFGTTVTYLGHGTAKFKLSNSNKSRYDIIPP